MVDEPKRGALVGVRVLVVEDHEDSRDILQQVWGAHPPPVIAVTGFDDDRNVAGVGFARVLRKPIDPWRLCEEIHAVLQGRPGG